MTLREFINQASKIKPELLDKPVVTIAENGLKMRPVIKFSRIELGNLDLTTENVEYVVITYEGA